MENFIFTFNAVMPLFVVIGFGYLLKRHHYITEPSITQLNKICFRFLIPCSLFQTAWKSNIRGASYQKLIVFSVLFYIVIVVALCLIIPRVVKGRKQQSAVIHCAFRSNNVLFGLPLAINLFGETAAAPMSILVSILVPSFNVLSVFVLTIFGDSDEKNHVDVKKIVRGLMTNPLIWSGVIGMLFSYWGVKLPTIVSTPIADLAKMATPLAMTVLGARFEFASAYRNLRLSSLSTAIKLIVLPLVSTVAGLSIGLRGAELGAIFVACSSPTAVASVAMSESMGSDGALTAEIVVLTSLCSCVTIFLGAFLMRQIGLF